MIKQIEIHYCDFCQQETNNDRIIKMPKKNNNEIIFVDYDICQLCYNQLITYLLSFKSNKEQQKQEEKEEQMQESTNIETQKSTPELLTEVKQEINSEILLPKERELILSSYIIPENKKIPLLNKSYNEALILPQQYPPTKIFLGALSHNKSLAIESPFIPPYMLDSLLDFPLSFTKLSEDYFKWIRDNNIEFFLDSGAFTYMNNPKKEINLPKYIERYINFINHFNITHFFELDLDHMIGLDAVIRIREYLYQKTGIIPIPVWHKSRGREEWTNMCKNYDFIAIGGIASKEIKPSEAVSLITDLCNEAHAYNTKVHGLGFALLDLLNNYIMPCDTIDTTSWNTARRSKRCTIEDGKIVVQYGTVSYESKINVLNDLETWCEFSRLYVKHNSKEEQHEKN